MKRKRKQVAAALEMAPPPARVAFELTDDFFMFPWVNPDSSVDELTATHLIQYLPLRDVCDTDAHAGFQLDRLFGLDMAVAFFEEAWRVLKPGGRMTVIVPALRSDRAFADPRIRRQIPHAWFALFSRAWRDANGYKGGHMRCDFAITVDHSSDTALGVVNPGANRWQESWNMMYDLRAVLVAIK